MTFCSKDTRGSMAKALEAHSATITKAIILRVFILVRLLRMCAAANARSQEYRYDEYSHCAMHCSIHYECCNQNYDSCSSYRLAYVMLFVAGRRVTDHLITEAASCYRLCLQWFR